MATDPTWTAQWDQAKWAVNEYNKTHQGDPVTLTKVLDTSTAVVKDIFYEKFLILVDTNGNPTSQRTCSAKVSQTCENKTVVKKLDSFSIINN